jgi:protein involved in polysaccharide export with SLBB domain
MRASHLGPWTMFALVSVTSATIPPRPAAGRQEPDAAYRVLVTGEVRYPGRVTLTASTMTVPDALAAVGSPTGNAGGEAVVIHQGDGGPPELRTIDLAQMDVGRAGLDITLQAGDIVNVPAAKRFYASGFVKNPGVYKLLPGTTVARAIVMVGGLVNGGSDRRITISRLVKGKRIAIAARLDDLIQADDEIKVQRAMF